MESVLNTIINETARDGSYGILGNEPTEITQALNKLERLGLIRKIAQGMYELTPQGQKAYAIGGFKKWQETTGRMS